MVYLDINKKNFKTNGKDLVKELDHHLGRKNNKCFILIFMEGCGPCNATRPEWKKIESALKDQYAKNDKLIVVDVNDYKVGTKF
jgi:hypothetical protein